MAKMSKKQYILLAGALRTAREQEIAAFAGREMDSTSLALHGVSVATKCISEALARDNKKFDPRHFLAVVMGEKELGSWPDRNR